MNKDYKYLDPTQPFEHAAPLLSDECLTWFKEFTSAICLERVTQSIDRNLVQQAQKYADLVEQITKVKTGPTLYHLFAFWAPTYFSGIDGTVWVQEMYEAFSQLDWYQNVDPKDFVPPHEWEPMTTPPLPNSSPEKTIPTSLAYLGPGKFLFYREWREKIIKTRLAIATSIPQWDEDMESWTIQIQLLDKSEHYAVLNDDLDWISGDL